MKSAFTIIELIFVIVILGVLAAVAIPRLSATRNDARASTIAFNLADCIEFSGSAFMMNQAFDVTSDSCLAATVNDACFTLTPNNANGTLLVRDVAGAPVGSACLASQALAGRTNTSSAVGVTHQF